jgi:hypothetical protein
MTQYKLYLVNQAGHFYRSFDLDCDDDGQAIQAALIHEKGAPKELWQGARIVQRFGQPTEPKAPVCDGERAAP